MLRRKLPGRFRRKSASLLFLLLATAILLYYQFYGLSISLSDFRLDFSTDGFATHDYHNRDRLHFSKYRYSLADAFAAHEGGWSTLQLPEKSSQEKCADFFRYLDSSVPDWETPHLRDAVYDKFAVKTGRFFADLYPKVKKQKNKDNVPDPENITDEDTRKINENFADRANATVATEQTMGDVLTVLRVFGHCFYGEDSSVRDSHGDLFQKFSRKVVPFFHNMLPTFEPPDGQHISGRFPNGPDFDGDNDSVLLYYHRNIRGKGIVISASTRYARDISRLIRVLRSLNNKLPIQIVHRGDLLMKARKIILGSGVANVSELASDHYTDQSLSKKILPHLDLSHPEQHGIDLPIQHITFVNVQEPLRRVSRSDFGGYSNKILAYFFNTFEEMVLLDADAVPLAEPNEILKLPEYSSTGAYFFRDRSLRDSNDWIETNFFLKMMPHEHSDFDKSFGIRPVTDHTLNIQYMRGWRHAQEAGVVLFNRRKHFASSLIMFPLAFWGDPIKSSIWGDKEMYWLSMAIAGDEAFTMNKYGAASVGQVTDDPARKMYNGTSGAEVCSTHPGHVNAEGKLLWINSGFSFCKKNGYFRDSHIFPFSAVPDKEKVRTLYEEPLRIVDAVVPPELPTLRPMGNPVDVRAETKFVLDSLKRKKDVDDIDNINQIDAYKPQKGWIKNNCCTQYYYCAYNEIESYDNSGNADDSGSVFHFEEADRTKYDFLGKMWITGIKTLMNFDITMPSIEDYPTY